MDNSSYMRLSIGIQKSPANEIPDFGDIFLNNFLCITDCGEVSFNNMTSNESFRINSSSDHYITSNKVHCMEHKKGDCTHPYSLQSFSSAFTIQADIRLIIKHGSIPIGPFRCSLHHTLRSCLWRAAAVGCLNGAQDAK